MEDYVDFETHVIKMIKSKQTESDEFKLYLKVYGKEKLKAIWLKWLQREKKVENKG